MKRKNRIGSMVHRIDLLLCLYLKSPAGEGLLSPNCMRSLEYIDAHPDCTQAEVADAIRVTPAAIAQNIKRMVAEGYVEKVACPGNLRANSLRIMDKGRLAAEKCKRVFDNAEKEILEGFDDTERERLERYLERIIDNLESSATDGLNNIELSQLLVCAKNESK